MFESHFSHNKCTCLDEESSIRPRSSMFTLSVLIMELLTGHRLPSLLFLSHPVIPRREGTGGNARWTFLPYVFMRVSLSHRADWLPCADWVMARAHRTACPRHAHFCAQNSRRSLRIRCTPSRGAVRGAAFGLPEGQPNATGAERMQHGFWASVRCEFGPDSALQPLFAVGAGSCAARERTSPSG